MFITCTLSILALHEDRLQAEGTSEEENNALDPQKLLKVGVSLENNVFIYMYTHKHTTNIDL